MVSSIRAELLSLFVFLHLGRTQWLNYMTVPASPELVQELEMFWSYGKVSAGLPNAYVVSVQHQSFSSSELQELTTFSKYSPVRWDGRLG